MELMLRGLEADFAGHERLRQLLLNKTPRYGNDDDAADDLMVRVFEAYFGAVDGRPNTRGGTYHINLLPTTVHVYFGSVIGATPDGPPRRSTGERGRPRRCRAPTGKDPRLSCASVAKMDQVRTGGTLLNQKFTPPLGRRRGPGGASSN